MTDNARLSYYKYYLISHLPVRVSYDANDRPFQAETPCEVHKHLQTDNTLVFDIVLNEENDTEEIPEHRFAELCMQKGVKTR